jgi:hypothetical protein
MNSFKSSLSILENGRLFSKYPQAISDLFEKVMRIDEHPKEGLYKTISQGLKESFFNLDTFRDWLKFRKM